MEAADSVLIAADKSVFVSTLNGSANYRVCIASLTIKKGFVEHVIPVFRVAPDTSPAGEGEEKPSLRKYIMLVYLFRKDLPVELRYHQTVIHYTVSNFGDKPTMTGEGLYFLSDEAELIHLSPDLQETELGSDIVDYDVVITRRPVMRNQTTQPDLSKNSESKDIIYCVRNTGEIVSLGSTNGVFGKRLPKQAPDSVFGKLKWLHTRQLLVCQFAESHGHGWVQLVDPEILEVQAVCALKTEDRGEAAEVEAIRLCAPRAGICPVILMERYVLSLLGQKQRTIADQGSEHKLILLARLKLECPLWGLACLGGEWVGVGYNSHVYTFSVVRSFLRI